MKHSCIFFDLGLPVRYASLRLAVTMMLSPWTSARADEGGVSFWLPGQYSSFAAVPQAPGWYLPIQLYYYN